MSDHTVDVIVSGTGWVEEPVSQLLIPRLNNAYEQRLYESVLETTGIEYWHVNKFADSAGLPHMPAMESAFEQAVQSSGLKRKIKKKNGNRVGLIYFDHYGPISFMERQAQIKEMYYSDVFPSLVLQSHNISGYSVRLRAERNAAMQAIKLAKDLIKANELDVVFVGGVNPCYSFFYLSEQLETHKWELKQGAKPTYESDTRRLSEAAGFIVLESAENAEQRGHEPKANLESIETGREYYSSDKANESTLHKRFDALSHDFNVESVWMGLYQSSLVKKTESMLLKDAFPNAHMNNLCEVFNDTGSLNPLRILHEQYGIQEIDTREASNFQLIHSTDRSGFGWNLLTK